MKAELKKSDGQTNIDKYSLTANITKLTFLRIIKIHDDKTIISCKECL